MSLLKVRLEGRAVPLGQSRESGIESEHKPAERAARAGLRLDLDVDGVGLPSADAVICRASFVRHVSDSGDDCGCSTSGF